MSKARIVSGDRWSFADPIPVFDLEFGNWNLIGIWDLGFGISGSSGSLRLPSPRQQRLQLVQELADVLELAVDGREPDVGHFVELLQPLHHERSDLARRHLAF